MLPIIFLQINAAMKRNSLTGMLESLNQADLVCLGVAVLTLEQLGNVIQEASEQAWPVIMEKVRPMKSGQ